MSSVVEKALPFDCLNINDFFHSEHNVVADGWNFIKRLLDIYDNGVNSH